MSAGLVSPDAPPGLQMLPLPYSWVVPSAGVPNSPLLMRIFLTSFSLITFLRTLSPNTVTVSGTEG